MSDLLQEYKDYYNVRAKRYEGDPDYPKSYEAEKAMADAMNSCNELSEFKDKLGNLNELSGVAHVMDTSLMENKHYNEIKEHVRALATERILEKCANTQSINEAITVVQEESNKNSIEISLDEATREFHDWTCFDLAEIMSKAEVPSEYEKQVRDGAQTWKNRFKERVEGVEQYLQPWENGHQLNFDKIYEDRHFRLLPYPKESIDRRRAEAKDWTGR